MCARRGSGHHRRWPPLLVLLWAAPAGAATFAAQTGDALSVGQAILFGIVEGLTEFLPISSTGHLLLLARILDVGQHGASEDAIKSYEIAIQAGAILAVLGLYRHRFATMVEGSPVGARTGAGPDRGPDRVRPRGPGRRRVRERDQGRPLRRRSGHRGLGHRRHPDPRADTNGLLSPRAGRVLELFTPRDTVVIGSRRSRAVAGTSRSLVTIVAALLLGYSMAAAVEFSFLLGFVTLGAATGYQVLKDGQDMIDTFGWFTPLVGLVAAFLAAAVSIKWMVGYLQRHDLSIFGWYRIVVAVVARMLVITGAIYPSSGPVPWKPRNAR